jgi:hypothetical protein
LGAAGAGLVPALDALQAASDRLIDGTSRAALDDWQESLLTAGRRLEAAWLALEEQAEQEERRWGEVEMMVSSWRRPLWPVVVVGVPALAVASWLGLVLGGYLTPPAWLVQVWSVRP